MEEDDYILLDDFCLQFRSMKQEIADLKSRVAFLEGLISTNDDVRESHKRQRKNDACHPIKLSVNGFERKHVSGNYRDNCDFCVPLRCRNGEERISMIPSILSLLVESEFISVAKLGALSCVSPMLRWLYLRWFRWRYLVDFACKKLAKHHDDTEWNSKWLACLIVCGCNVWWHQSVRSR